LGERFLFLRNQVKKPELFWQVTEQMNKEEGKTGVP